MHSDRPAAHWAPNIETINGAPNEIEAVPVAADMEYHRVHAQSDPVVDETRGALLLPDSPSANNSRLQAQASPPSKDSNGTLKEAERHDASLSMDNGMLEAQPDNSPRETEERNGTADRHSKQGKSAFQNTLENFTPKWFAISMNTGILAILVHEIPYQFKGLYVLSIIMYLVDLTLFVIVCSMTILRWALYPKAAKRKSAASIDEIAFLAAAPITFLYLTSLTGIIVSNAYWGGHAWSLVAYSMWWIGMAWMLTMCTYIGSSCLILP